MENKVSDARRAALTLLCDVTIEGRLLSEMLPKRLRTLAPEDRARAQRLVTTTLRMMDRSDRMLGPYLKRRPSDRVLNILRLGVAEICEDKSAAHGVVNDMVNLVRLDKNDLRLAGLVNAVLRKISRDTDKWLSLPIPRLPKWLRKPLIADYGKQVVADMEAAFHQGAPLDITAKSNADAVAKALNGELLQLGSVRLQSYSQISTLPGFNEGDWWVQDVAAAMPARILAPQKGEHILDLCAAPGGKTMQLSAAGANVTALDISKARMQRLDENLKRCALPADKVIEDALKYNGTGFDAILLDAPCSATGTIRRHPDLPYAKDGSEFPELFALQIRLIDKALSLLKPGGRLLYCTCSLLIDEGEEQIKDALARHKGLETDPQALMLPGIDPAWIDKLGGLRLRPDYNLDKGGMDGFYIALLKKPA